MTSIRTGKLAEDDFAASPLVIWIQSYLGSRKASNDELSNGVILNNVLNLIDPNAFSSLHIRTHKINDVSSRAQNLVEILNGIKRYYQEKLQQVVVMKMPDILLLAKESRSELSYSAMNDILLLILGCAIQCEKKEEFIEHIKQLDVDVQRGLVASIQEITENPDNVIPYRVNDFGDISRDELLMLCENLYRHLQGAMEQRDDYIETIIDFVLLQDSEEYREKLNEESPKFRPRNSITQASFHSSNMLQAKNERICSLQAELDEQNVLMSDMKEELEQMKLQVESMRLENKHLVNEAVWAKSYRDELDVLKAQLENTNKLRSENARLKGIAEDVDFYKKKYEEMQDQTDLLYEQKLLLEEQAKDSSGKISRLNLLENENKKLCTQVNLLVEEQSEDQRRIRELVDEIAKLSVEKQESMSACSVMNAELDGLRMAKEDDGLNVPLMVEYNQSADLLRLEKDNRHLQSIVDTMSVPDMRIKGLEDYNRNLAENIIYYKNLIGKLIKCLILAGDTNQEICDVTKREYSKMLQILGNIKHASQLDNITKELECLVSQLAKKGLVIDASTLKEALVVKSDQKTTSENGASSPEEFVEQSKLRDILEDKDKRLADLETHLEKLKELTQKNEELTNDNSKKEEKITCLEESLKKLDELSSINEQLKGDVTNKDREVANIKKSMEESTEAALATTQLKSEIANKDESIRQLKDNLDRSNELITKMNSQLKNDVTEKEQKVAKLKQSELKLKDVRIRNSELENEINHKDNTIDYLRQSLENLNNVSEANSQLKEDLLLKEKKMANFKESLDKLKELSDVNEQLKDIIKSKDQKLSLLKENVAKVIELTTLNNQLKDALTIKEQKIMQLEESINGLEDSVDGSDEIKKILEIKEKEIKDREKDIGERDKEIIEKTSALQESDDTIREIEDELKIVGKQLKNKEKELDDKNKENTIKDNELKNREVKIKDKDNEVKEKEKEIKIKEKEIKEKDKEIKEKEKDIKEKEKELTVVKNKLNEVNNQLEKSEEKCEELKKNAENELKKIGEKIPELQRTSSESGKLKSIVKEKDNQILLLHDSLNEFQCKASQLETRIEELTSANNRSSSAVQQKDERLVSLKTQLEEHLSSNRTLSNELKMKEEKLKSVTRSLEETMKRNNDLEEDINMLEKDLEQLKQTGSLKNITNITEKIKLTKRARTELHIQRCPVKMKQKTSNIEVKPSNELNEYRELVEKLHQENQCMEKQTATMTEDIKNLSNENASLQMENETIMSTLNLLKLDYEAIQREMDEAREHFQELDISATKIAHRCEVLVQLNATLEEENKAMMEQVNKLFAQNQDLLVSTLYNREQYIEDERAFSEHIYELEREKDKLSDQIFAAEKALQQDGRKKGALWRGTHKILKRAGLAKISDSDVSGAYTTFFERNASDRKDSNAKSGDFSSLSIEDIEKDGGGIVPLTRENRMSLESIHSVRNISRVNNNSSPVSSLYRNIRPIRNGEDHHNSTAPPLQNFSTNSTPRNNGFQKNGHESLNHTPNANSSLLRPVHRNSDSSPILSSSQRKSNPALDDHMSTPNNNKPTGHSTPIQKVFVTQLTTPTVMKASPDGMNVDFHTNSPNFIRKVPLPGEKNPLELPGKTGNIKGLRKQSFSTSSSRSSPLLNDRQPSYIDENGLPTVDKESKLLDRRNYTNFKEIMTDTMSLDSSDEAAQIMFNANKSPAAPRRGGGPDDLRHDNLSPTLGTHPFGSREQRSSFRRYEIEHMEPRPLPQNDAFGSEEDILNGSTKSSSRCGGGGGGGMRNNKTVVENNHSSEEQRTSLRKVMIGNNNNNKHQNNDSPLNHHTPPPPPPSSKKDINNSNSKKHDQSWYEYGHV